MLKFFRRRVRRRRPRSAAATLHYETHKEVARRLIHERLAYWNTHYNFIYKRVAIRDQRSRWGSCSALGNLNFNYRLIFLAPELLDYVIVHELCHLKEFNHSPAFWSLVAQSLPDYRHRVKAIRAINPHTAHALKQIS